MAPKRKGRPLLVAAVGVAAISYVQGAIASSDATPTDPVAEPAQVTQHPVGNLRPPPPPPDAGTPKP